MKLFVREQFPLIAAYAAQLAVVTLIYWLGGFTDGAIIGYAALVSGSILAGYLGYRFVSQRALYGRLSAQPQAPEETAPPDLGPTPLAEAVSRLTTAQYAGYAQRIGQLEEKLLARDTFITQWAHQMKTPLSVIQMTVQEEDGPPFLGIQEEAERLQKGLETVLYTSRLDRFEHDFVVEPVSLLRIARQAVTANRRLFIRNRVYPDVRIAETALVYSDEKWLAFALDQLVTNAVKYSSGSGRNVEISADERELQTVLQVRDYGIGIPKHDIRRVFEPYFTGSRGREFSESTGMGLYLVREICARLGHAVELESEVGAGTTVRIVFAAKDRSC
ncbi:sensor histidine kinase [Paenibacillus cymbidii]|uniref:sensor histidine kinase n=1 Tax=Paenibacillus cymbidii TaxID=1639034 RepID=UPI00108151C5|nr:sensor histidine kinase [Paenibacillus cymbidii]